jgi:hypothetical protein
MPPTSMMIQSKVQVSTTPSRSPISRQNVNFPFNVPFPLSTASTPATPIWDPLSKNTNPVLSPSFVPSQSSATHTPIPFPAVPTTSLNRPLLPTTAQVSSIVLKDYTAVLLPTQVYSNMANYLKCLNDKCQQHQQSQPQTQSQGPLFSVAHGNLFPLPLSRPTIASSSYITATTTSGGGGGGGSVRAPPVSATSWQTLIPPIPAASPPRH